VELVKHYTTLGGIGKNITQHLMELVKHYTTLDEFGETLHNIWWNL
jgi:hypothetical protein